MHVVCLSAEDCRLLAERFAVHGNSHRRLAGALKEAGALDTLERAGALRRLEANFEIDLGSLCHRFARRDHPSTHPSSGWCSPWRPGGRARKAGANSGSTSIECARYGN